MRIAMLTLLVVAGGLRFVDDPARFVHAKPPAEIRLVDETSPERKARIEEIRRDFPSLHRHRTPRFEILTDQSAEAVGEASRLLERTALEVDDFCRALGYATDRKAPAASDRYLVIAFSAREDFIRFARCHDGLDAAWLAGYFAPNPGHLVYHNPADSHSVRTARSRIERLSQDRRGAEEQRRLARENLDHFITQTNAAVVVHEATHMILHELGIARATVDRPDWLLEGLAGSFEPVEASQAFGPLRPRNGRTEQFRAMLAERGQPTLRDLVCRRRFPSRSHRLQGFYATSAAFCGWLARNRPAELKAFIDRAGEPRVGIVDEDFGGTEIELIPAALAAVEGDFDDLHEDAEELRHEFEEVFGPIDELERVWLRAERASAHLPLASAENIGETD